MNKTNQLKIELKELKQDNYFFFEADRLKKTSFWNIEGLMDWLMDYSKVYIVSKKNVMNMGTIPMIRTPEEIDGFYELQYNKKILFINIDKIGEHWALSIPEMKALSNLKEINKHIFFKKIDNILNRNANQIHIQKNVKI